MKKAWSITELANKMMEDLALCNTDLERSLCETICLKEIISKAKKKKRLTRKEKITIIQLNGGYLPSELYQ